MKSRPVPRKSSYPHVIIRVSGMLFQGHLSYLNQLVQSAEECRLWPVLKLERLEELDRAALAYLVQGENCNFGLDACPNFIRERIEQERQNASAA